jgi:YgiT-type zinc finger domain-containing protein
MAGALLCPTCIVEYVEIEFDMEVDGIVIHNVRALKCPGCNEEVFTSEQQEEVRRQITKS